MPRRPRSKGRVIQPLNDAKEIQFLRAAQEAPHCPLWLLTLVTVVQRGELLGLLWEDRVVQKRFRHSNSSATLDIYSHTLSGMQEEASEVLRQALAL